MLAAAAALSGAPTDAAAGIAASASAAARLLGAAIAATSAAARLLPSPPPLLWRFRSFESEQDFGGDKSAHAKRWHRASGCFGAICCKAVMFVDAVQGLPGVV
jgi:hypothetical protein